MQRRLGTIALGMLGASLMMTGMAAERTTLPGVTVESNQSRQGDGGGGGAQVAAPVPEPVAAAPAPVEGDNPANAIDGYVAESTSTGSDAVITLAVGLILSAALPLVSRWADMLPLGGPTAQALGMSVGRARLAIPLLTAALSATATLVVGPLTFVGLIAPHLARMPGFQRALAQLAGAAPIGALIMVSADWLGRALLFPRQIPAGLAAALIGAPYFLWRMRRP